MINSKHALKDMWMTDTQTKTRLGFLDELIEQRQVIQDAHDNWVKAKEVAASRKKKYEAEVSQLHEMLDDDPDQQKLFSREQTVEVRPDDADPGEPVGGFAPNPWQEMDIVELQRYGVTESQTDRLIEAGFSTMGDLQARMLKEGAWWWKDVKGVGEGKAEKINEALTAIVTEQQAKSGELDELDPSFEAKEEAAPAAQPEAKSYGDPHEYEDVEDEDEIDEDEEDDLDYI